MSRPPYKPPSGGGRRTAVAFVAIILVFAFIAYAVAFFWPNNDDDEGPITASPVALVGDVTTGSVIIDVVGGSGSPDVPVLTATATTDEEPPADEQAVSAALIGGESDSCQTPCLVRLTDSRRVSASMAKNNLRSVYAASGNIWAGMTATEIAAVRADGFSVDVIDASADTLNVFAVRTPENSDNALVRAFGDIIDQVGDQYLVRVPRIPVDAAPLTNAGILVEKFPPLPPDEIQPLGTAMLDPDLLWQLSGQIANSQLESITRDLEGMGAEEGAQFGSRFYEQPGNVATAEYLYRRFEALGLTVNYRDFLADNGLLALNVIAELPGDDPSKVYMVMAHFDSLNRDDNAGPAPGGDDNASGVSAMLEIARVLAGYHLPHPVLFFASNAEESVFQGAQAYASQAAREGTTITAAFNLDAVGSPRNGNQIVFNADGDAAPLVDLLISVNDSYGLDQTVLVPKDPTEIIADDTVMRDWGIPTVLIARELYGWTDVHHTANDVAETVDFFNVRMAAELTLIAVATLLTDDQSLGASGP